MNRQEGMKEFFAKPPEIIVEWEDTESSAKGWLVINSLRGGAAGGGTRMRANCNKEEVIELAKTMEIKFRVSGPDIGGAKSGIAYDFKSVEDKRAVLGRWFKFIAKHLKTHYGTGGDQNLDFAKDIAPALLELGIKHPQEGIIRGHYPDFSEESQDKIINNLRTGVNLQMLDDKFLSELKYTLSDTATGFGVVSAVESFYNLIGDSLKNKRVILEGFGSVGGVAAYYASQKGAKVVGIIDKDWYIFDSEGIDIEGLLKEKSKKILFEGSSKMVIYGRPKIEDYPQADLFLPCATSHTIDREFFEKLLGKGVKLISSGANNPFDSSDVEVEADNKISIIPDFVANCGTARIFSYFMQPDCKLETQIALDDIEKTIKSFIKKIIDKNNSEKNIIRTAQDIILENLI